MLQLFVLTIFLIASPSFGLIETLFAAERNCYSGCISNYGGIASNLDACKSGCFFKLHHENCADQCKLHSIHEQIQASCVVGCSMNRQTRKQLIENLRPHSIILIRLRQHPSPRYPVTYDEQAETLHNIIKKMREQSKAKLMRKNPTMKLSNEEHTKQSKHTLIQEEDKHDQLQQLMKQIRSKWQNITPKESKLPAWVLFSLFVLTSTMLWYMIVSLCRNKPKHQNLSVSAEDLIFEKDILHLATPGKTKSANI